MLRVICDVCGTELDEPGAILLSPPDEVSSVIKAHVCRGCWDDLTVTIKEMAGAPKRSS